MDDTPLVGGHRLEGERDAPCLDTPSHLACESLKGAVAPLLVAFDIDSYGRPLVCLPGDEQPNDVLQSGERLSPSADKDAQVVAYDIEGQGFRGFFI